MSKYDLTLKFKVILLCISVSTKSIYISITCKGQRKKVIKRFSKTPSLFALKLTFINSYAFNSFSFVPKASQNKNSVCIVFYLITLHTVIIRCFLLLLKSFIQLQTIFCTACSISKRKLKYPSLPCNRYSRSAKFTLIIFPPMQIIFISTLTISPVHFHFQSNGMCQLNYGL